MIEIQHDLFHALAAVLHGSRTEPNLLLLVYYSSSTRRKKKDTVQDFPFIATSQSTPFQLGILFLV